MFCFSFCVASVVATLLPSPHQQLKPAKTRARRRGFFAKFTTRVFLTLLRAPRERAAQFDSRELTGNSSQVLLKTQERLVGAGTRIPVRRFPTTQAISTLQLLWRAPDPPSSSPSRSPRRRIPRTPSASRIGATALPSTRLRTASTCPAERPAKPTCRRKIRV